MDEGAPSGGREDKNVAKDDWSYLAYCPNCGSKLANIKCKARCPSCGFFQDCGDTIV